MNYVCEWHRKLGIQLRLAEWISIDTRGTLPFPGLIKEFEEEISRLSGIPKKHFGNDEFENSRIGKQQVISLDRWRKSFAGYKEDGVTRNFQL